MRILLVSSSSGSKGGGEIFLLYLAKGLIKQGHKVALWCSGHERMNSLAEQFSFYGDVFRDFNYQNTYDLTGRSLQAVLPSFYTSKRALSFELWRPDLIHVNKQNLEDALDLLASIHYLKLPHLTTIHITQSASYLGARWAGIRDAIACKALFRDRGTLVTVSDGRQRELERFLPGKKVHSVYNGVELPTTYQLQTWRKIYREKLGISHELLVMAVGRMVPQKQPLVFLEWAKYLRSIAFGLKLKFIWVGDGEMAAIWQKKAAELGLADCAQSIGWQTDATKWLAAADLYWHPAQYEGLPLALLEAMSTGLPCVIQPNLVQEALVLQEATVLATPKMDWMKPLLSETQREWWGKNARKHAENSFSLEAMTSKYVSLYNSSVNL
jgi:glycosyltransferase involved in cell wall biosynthesis